MCPATMPAASRSQSSAAQPKGVDHGRERDPRVGASAGDHDLGAAAQGLDHGPGAVVGVGRRHAIADRRERRAVLHVVERDAAGVQLAQAVHQVVPDHRRHLERLPVELRRLDQRRAARQRIDAAGVGDDLDAALGEDRQSLLDLGHEVAREPRARVAGALLLHDGHRDLGQEVEGHDVHGAELDLALELRQIVAPVAAGVRDAQHVEHGGAC
jgi:hypothetical protein